MTERINQILKDLIGLPLTRTTRAADMECLKFGTQIRLNKEGDLLNYGEFGLHLQCPWRFTNEKGIIVGSADLFEQVDENAEYTENFDWDIKGGNLRDVKLWDLIAEKAHIVKSVNADKYGGLQIDFESNIVLTVFSTISSKSYNEYWRLMDNKDESKSHYISTSNGFELD